MSKRHRRAAPPEVDPEVLVEGLRQRAKDLSLDQAHLLGSWQPAKKKWGKGAVHAYCRNCGGMVIVSPRGSEKVGKTPQDHHAPAIFGDLPFERCEGDEGMLPLRS